MATDARIPVRSSNRMWQLFDEYVEEINSSPLSPSSKTDYRMFAEFFMRWLDGEFEPGGSLK